MRTRTVMLLGVMMSLLLVVMQIPAITVTLQLLDGTSRAAVPKFMSQLRYEGMWLSNVTITDVHADEHGLACFSLVHTYRGRTFTKPTEELRVCL